MRYIATVLIAALLLSACKKEPEKTQPMMERITESVYASGIIKSKNQYQVFSTVGGLIQKILVKEGDVVKKGDALFVIQSESSKLNAENAKLSADFADLNTRGDRLNELKSVIETARSKMLNDSLLLLRQRGLWAQQIGSKVELEQRELAYTSSANNYESAVLRYKDLQKQLKFAAAQSQKLLSISKTIAQDFTIRSQTDGRVYSISKELGEIVNIQSPVAIIGDAEEFVAELQVDESDIARIRLEQRVLLTLDSYKGQVLEAAIAKIDPLMNERTRTFTVEANFTKIPPTLYPNLTTEANIVIQTKEKAMTIPRAYLLNDSLVMLENKEKRMVEIGLKDYMKVEILSGLSANETILSPEAQ
ncbi:MAG: HlyD family efflux transporter periplasmic adaptor subunit [Saprospiraceae bacterium]|nr:HlyD family efflux transporter periplasmic adaptor subunit [Saprospiraceae bacterium]